VRRNIAFGLEIRKRPKAEVAERVAELIKLVQLEGFGDRYPSQLSGGQRQRMALARALAVEPEVLLLDEPFGALDARVRTELRAWLRRLHDDMHVTTVFVTHDQEEAMEVADTVVVMNHGRIIQEGNPQDVYDHPADEFVMHFMGHVNVIGDAYVRPHDVEIRVEPNGTTSRAVVKRVLRLGAQVRVELVVDGGETVAAELSRDEAERLPLEPGEPVFVRPRRERRFAEADVEASAPA
jgi:sulfate transport system ATP-binding protein